MHSRGIRTISLVPLSRGGQKIANPARDINTVADGRKGDPQQDVEEKNIPKQIPPGNHNGMSHNKMLTKKSFFRRKYFGYEAPAFEGRNAHRSIGNFIPDRRVCVITSKSVI